MPSVEANPTLLDPVKHSCPLCDAQLEPSNPNECPKCDWVTGYRRRRMSLLGSGRDTAAVFMSAIPGLGHLYKGHPVMAAIAFTGAVMASMAVAVAATATMGLALMLLPIYWIGVMMHACWIDDAAQRPTRQAA
jgi:hypothetical protein